MGQISNPFCFLQDFFDDVFKGYIYPVFSGSFLDKIDSYKRASKCLLLQHDSAKECCHTACQVTQPCPNAFSHKSLVIIDLVYGPW